MCVLFSQFLGGGGVANMLLFDFIQACEILKGFVTAGSIFSLTQQQFSLFLYPQVCAATEANPHIAKSRNCRQHTQYCITRCTITAAPPVLCFLQNQNWIVSSIMESTKRLKVMGSTYCIGKAPCFSSSSTSDFLRSLSLFITFVLNLLSPFLICYLKTDKDSVEAS